MLEMKSSLWIKILLAVAMEMLKVVAARNYWHGRCGRIKQQLENNQDVGLLLKDEVVGCISACLHETAGRAYDITPEECFRSLVEPYIEKVVKTHIPTDDEVQTCLNAEDRSNCRDTLLYYFSKWYKDNYSADYDKKFATFLFSTWAYIPALKGTTFSQWEQNVASALFYIKYESDQDVQAALKITSLSDPIQYPVIHREIKRYCYKPIKEEDFSTSLFCRLRLLMNVASKIRTLAQSKQKYHQNLQKYTAALRSNFIAFSVIFPGHSTGTEEENTLAIDRQLNELTDLTRAGNTDDLQTFLQFMPEPYLLKKVCKQDKYPVLSRRCCIFEKVVEQLLIYSGILTKRKKDTGKKVVTINFSLNLRAVITELRSEEIFKIIVDERYQDISDQEATASLIEGKFGQIKSYFSKLQSFNMQKASADVAYVKDRIKYYESKAKTAISDVSDQVGGILRAAFITQELEVGEKVIKLTLAIVEACNPLKAVFNGGTATDIVDALAELMKAISDLVKAIALKDAWEDVISIVKVLNAGFQENSEFLSAVGRIVDKVNIHDHPNDDEFEQSKSTFLRLYKDYSPKVDKEMLEVLASKIEISVSEGCTLIEAATGSAANGYVAYVKRNLFCQKAEASTSSLKTIFEEIYDFQFEFIENMASYMRSATGYQASQQMVTLSSSPKTQSGDADKRTRELKANIIMARITYEIQKEGAIQSLCDFLEYKEGGEAPAVCKSSTIDVPTLLSYIPTRCQSVNMYVSIPITTSKKAIPGHVNIKKLYSGEEVPFDIPSYDWMKQQKWIGQGDNFKAIYVKNFEVFLPTINRGKGKVEVTVRAMGGNRFKEKGSQYALIPSESFSTVYTGGDRYHPCSGKKIENPFNICEDRKLPDVCVMSEAPISDDTKVLYPTTFARFKIKASSVASSQAPDPQTPLDLKAKIKMCIFKSDTGAIKRTEVQPKEGCCSGNDYWNEGRSACQFCGGGSKSNLNGYYCENNMQALFEEKKEKRSSP